MMAPEPDPDLKWRVGRPRKEPLAGIPHTARCSSVPLALSLFTLPSSLVPHRPLAQSMHFVYGGAPKTPGLAPLE